MITVSVQRDMFSAELVLRELEALGGGAIASFVGVVRADDGVDGMRLEHYPGMTEKALTELAESAVKRWSLLGATIIHRVGELIAGDRIVVVATCAPHRRDALDSCAYLIDRLKTDAPFWKSERRRGEERWVDARSSDDAAAAGWDQDRP